MSPEGVIEAREAGLDVSDAVQRAMWRGNCLLWHISKTEAENDLRRMSRTGVHPELQQGNSSD